MAIDVFCSYAREDEALRDELHKRLKAFERGELIGLWHDRRILPGGDWGREIDEHLRSADMVLLLVSPDFLASEYANAVEVSLAMRRHQKGETVVVPVILRPCTWEIEYGQLQVLPKDGLPVTKWDDPDVAYLDIARAIQRFAEDLIGGRRNLGAPVLPEQLKARVSEAELDALERNYLAQVKADLDDRQLSPLGHTEDEEIALEAQIFVEPAYKVFKADVDPSVQPDRGERTSDLVRTLLESTEPVAVLGQPGAGKSVALRRVGLRLVDLGHGESKPRIPVYLPLGDFTTRLSTREPALAFATRTLLNRGGHATEIAARLRDYLHSGRVVFLLDAMDEMPRDDYKYRFEALRDLTRFGGNRFLFACREFDYRDSFRVTRAIIQPLNRAQARDLLVRAMPEHGREAANRILSPDNPRRNLATNPFFLRLFCLYYKIYKDLPPSRAALVEVFERAVYIKSTKYETEGLAVDQRTFHLALARLGYLITMSQRGVTLPLRAFRAGFRDGSAVLAQSFPHIDEVIRVAAEERLLVKDEHVDPGGDTTLSFYHHRLQEYYAAVYLDEFEPPLDWTQRYDDIWWQEILIMLFGVAESPDRFLRDLLATIPDPVTMVRLAPALANLVTSRGARGTAALSELDSSGFYGLNVQGEHVEELVSGIFRKPLAEVSYLDTPGSRSPKASSKPDEENVRRYLEQRNAILLDRVALVAECLQNVATKMPEAQERVKTILSAFIKDGNTWETVRAIRIGSQLRGIDLYGLIEPALIGGNTWCRQEALEAVANVPVELSPLRQVGVVLFLQFVKGDLLFSIVGFARQVWDRRALLWLVPGFLLLLALSVAAVLAPFAFYGPLLKVLRQRPAPPAALGMGWPGVAGAIIVASAGIIYFVKHRFKIPILYFPAWAGAFILDNTLPRANQNIAVPILLFMVTIFAPQIAGSLMSAIGCAIALISFGSVRVVRGWRASLREIWSDGGPFFGLQMLMLAIAGFGVLVVVWIAISDWIRVKTGVDIQAWPVIALGLAFTLFAAGSLLFGVLGLVAILAKATYNAAKTIVRPREALTAAVRQITSGVRRAPAALLGAVRAGGAFMLVAACILAPLFAFVGVIALVEEHTETSLRLAKPLALFLSIAVIVFLSVALVLPYFAVTYYEEFGQTLPVSVRRFRFFRFMETEAQRAMNLLAQYDGASAKARYDAFRTALPSFKEDRWQSVLYRQMEKAYKEIRQESGAQAAGSLGSGED